MVAKHTKKGEEDNLLSPPSIILWIVLTGAVGAGVALANGILWGTFTAIGFFAVLPVAAAWEIVIMILRNRRRRNRGR